LRFSREGGVEEEEGEDGARRFLGTAHFERGPGLAPGIVGPCWRLREEKKGSKIEKRGEDLMRGLRSKCAMRRSSSIGIQDA